MSKRIAFDVTLKGFRGVHTDETDHLVKWIQAPSILALFHFLFAWGLIPKVQSIDVLHPSKGHKYGFDDGIDVQVKADGTAEVAPENVSFADLCLVWDEQIKAAGHVPEPATVG